MDLIKYSLSWECAKTRKWRRPPLQFMCFDTHSAYFVMVFSIVDNLNIILILDNE